MKNNYLYVDTETTGTDSVNCAVVEIAAIVNNIEFQTYVKPFDGARISHEAMEVNGLSIAELQNAPDYKTVTDMFCKFLDQFVNRYDKSDKLIMAGYNIGFDDKFLRQMFKRAGNPYLGSYKWPTLYDVQTPAIAHLQNQRGDMVNFKLGTVANQLGITTPENLHNALDDIKLTIEIDNVVNPCQK